MAAKDRPLTMLAAKLCFGITATQRLEKGLCPICGEKPEHFKDETSAAEFELNGTCQSCQDRTFGKDH